MSTNIATTAPPSGHSQYRQLEADSRSTTSAVADAASDEVRQRLKQMRRWSNWLDDRFRIPGTSIRFGLDSLVGLIPGVGDSLTAVASGWILHHAHQSGVPKSTLARMAGNVAIDVCVGAIPILGDVFDLYWKSNTRNTRILEDYLQQQVDSGDE